MRATLPERRQQPGQQSGRPDEAFNIDASKILRRARLVKSPAEIAMMEHATRFAEIGIETIRREIRPGMTELDLFGLTTAPMMKAGSEFPAR